jgi:hypothetical protein
MVIRALTATLVITGLTPAAVHAAPGLSSFSLTPSTTQAGGHPNVALSFSFGEATTGVTAVAVHLPPGLSANPRAFPFCSQGRLVRDMCPAKSKVGSLRVTAVAYGFEVPVTSDIYNVAPVARDRVRLGVPIFVSYSGPGLTVEVPVVERPDTGLDLTVTGLPREVAGMPVRLKNLTASIRGAARTRVKKKVKRTPFLTNPGSCSPATSVLEVTVQDMPASPLTSSSAFTPSGC